MTAFLIIWLGQIISILASGMSNFALTIWMFQQTRSATAMGMMQVCYILPFLLISPIAGVMVDRYNRKLTQTPSCPTTTSWKKQPKRRKSEIRVICGKTWSRPVIRCANLQFAPQLPCRG